MAALPPVVKARRVAGGFPVEAAVAAADCSPTACPLVNPPADAGCLSTPTPAAAPGRRQRAGRQGVEAAVLSQEIPAEAAAAPRRACRRKPLRTPAVGEGPGRAAAAVRPPTAYPLRAAGAGVGAETAAAVAAATAPAVAAGRAAPPAARRDALWVWAWRPIAEVACARQKIILRNFWGVFNLGFGLLYQKVHPAPARGASSDHVTPAQHQAIMKRPLVLEIKFPTTKTDNAHLPKRDHHLSLGTESLYTTSLPPASYQDGLHVRNRLRRSRRPRRGPRPRFSSCRQRAIRRRWSHRHPSGRWRSRHGPQRCV